MAKAPVLENELDEEGTEAADQAADEAQAKARARGDFVDEDNPDADTLAAVAGEDDPDPDAEGETKEPKSVPYGRFKEVNESFTKERDARLRAEGEAEALRKMHAGAPKQEEAAAPAVDVKALRRAANKALMEGDEDKAAELQDQADAAVLEQATGTAVVRLREETAAAALNETAVAMVAKYPFLDSNGPDANKEAIADVVDLRDVYMRRGMSPSKALEKAAARIGESLLKADDEDDKPGKTSPEAAEARRVQGIARGAKAAAQQPSPLSGGKGARATASQEVDVMKMSDEEFAKLPKAEKARLRGDVV